MAPAVDLSILGLLLGTRHLALTGASPEVLQPERRLLIFASVVTLALNVAEPLVASEFGRAAFDAVGPLLLIGWSEVGPGLLQSIGATSRTPVARDAERSHSAVDVNSNEGARETQAQLDEDVLQHDRGETAVERTTEALLTQARREDAAHRVAHQKPISANTLRIRLGVGATRARQLVKIVRAEFDEQAGAQRAGVDTADETHAGAILNEVSERHAELSHDDEFQRELREFMTARTTRKSDVDGSIRSEQPSRRSRSYLTTLISCRDFPLTAMGSWKIVNDTLTSATGDTLIVATRLNHDSAARIKDVLLDLTQRNIQVDLLWSCDEETTDAKEVARILSAIRGVASAASAVTFNRAPSNLASDLIVTSSVSGPVALVGTNLLRSDEATALNPCARLSDPAALASLARLCAGWWEDSTDAEGSIPVHRWKHLAGRWAGEAAVAPPPAVSTCPESGLDHCTGELSLLLGPHQDAVQDEVVTANSPLRLLVYGQGRLTDEPTRKSEEAVNCESGGGAPPLDSVRIVATEQDWFVGYANNPTVVIHVTGHVASQAWRHLSGLASENSTVRAALAGKAVLKTSTSSDEGSVRLE